MSWEGFEQDGDEPVPENRVKVKVGDQFTHLTMVSTPRYRNCHVSKRSGQYAVFRCVCGKKLVYRVCDITRGHNQSCGCMTRATRIQKARKCGYRDGLKECGDCHKYLSPEKFYRAPRRYDSLTSYCKECYANRAREHRYGITREEYDRMLLAQGSVCAVCKRTEQEVGQSFCVDHCHASGKTRGILCHGCNTMIGLSKESPQTLMQGAAYLASYSETKAAA